MKNTLITLTAMKPNQNRSILIDVTKIISVESAGRTSLGRTKIRTSIIDKNGEMVVYYVYELVDEIQKKIENIYLEFSDQNDNSAGELN